MANLVIAKLFNHTDGSIDVSVTSDSTDSISTLIGADAEIILKLTDGLDNTSANQITKTLRAANVDQIKANFSANWLSTATTIYMFATPIGDGTPNSAVFSYEGSQHSGSGPITNFAYPTLIETGDYTLTVGSSQNQLSASVEITQALVTKSVTEFLVEIVLDTLANGTTTGRTVRRMKKVSIGGNGLGDTLSLIAAGDGTYLDNGANGFVNGQIWDVYVQAVNAGGVQQSYNHVERTLITIAPSPLTAAVVSKNDGSFDITINQNPSDDKLITEVTLFYDKAAAAGAQADTQTLVIKDANTDLGLTGNAGSQTATVNISGLTAGNVISNLKLTTFNTFAYNTLQDLDTFTYNGAANTNSEFTIETVPTLKAAVTAANLAGAATGTDLIGNTSIGFNLNESLSALANLVGLDTNTTNTDGAYVIKVLNAADDSSIGEDISLSALDSAEAFDLGQSLSLIHISEPTRPY